MSIQTIGVGAADNDGTGDTARTAFGKVNSNFAELASVGSVAPTPTGVAATDTDALQAWVTDSGAGAVLLLGQDTTWILDQGVELMPRQRLIGNGATITRVDQVATTTDTDITSGVTTAITVASADGLRVGQTIALQTGAATNYSAAREIASIVGLVVTVSSPFNITSTSQLNVYLVFNSLMTDDDVEVTGVRFDGNREHWAFNRWDLVSEIVAVGRRVRVERNQFIDLPCEGVQQVTVGTASVVARSTSINAGTNPITAGGTTATVADASIFEVGDYLIAYTASTGAKVEPLAHRISDITGSVVTIDAPGWWFAESSGSLTVINVATGCRITDNSFYNVGGNPVHLSGSTGTHVCRNTMVNVNLDADAGHRGGAVSWSWACSQAVVTDNYVNGCYCGFGTMSGMHVSGASITGNVVENATAYGLLSSTSITTPFAARDVTIANNTFRNCAEVYISNSGSTSDTTCYQQNFTITGNRFYATKLYLDRCYNTLVEGNYIYAPGNWTSSSSRAIVMSRLENALIAANTIVGGYYGALFNTALTRVTIRGNQFSGQYYFAVIGGGTSDVGVLIDGNNIINDATANASYRAVGVNGPQVVRNNTIRRVAGYGILAGSSTADFVIQGNTVKASSNTAIRIDSGCTGYIVTGNTISHAVLDNAGAGAPARVANNDVITIA